MANGSLSKGQEVPEDAFGDAPAPGFVSRFGRGLVDVGIGTAEGAKDVGRGLISLPGLAARAPGGWLEFARRYRADPAGARRELVEAANEFAKGLVPMYGTMEKMATGEPLTLRGLSREGAGLGLPYLGRKFAAKGIEAAAKVPGRLLALPGERHGLAGRMTESILGRFGVDDAMVSRLYAIAGNLSRRSGSTVELPNFADRLRTIRMGIEENPFPEIQDRLLLGKVSRTEQRAMAGTPGQQIPTPFQTSAGTPIVQTGPPSPLLVKAHEINSVIKGVNAKIGQASDATTRGAWKNILGGLHEDMRAAFRRTGDPAFAAYEQAIAAARKNFLKQDLQEVIYGVAVKFQRTGKEEIASPGGILNWMRRNPEWVESMEKAHPGVLRSIHADLQEVIPIANVTGTRIPGQTYGSGPFWRAGAGGYLALRALGMSHAEAEIGGAVAGLLSQKFGASLPGSYLRTSFRPIQSKPSPAVGRAAVAATRPTEPATEEKSLTGPLTLKPLPKGTPLPEWAKGVDEDYIKRTGAQ